MNPQAFDLIRANPIASLLMAAFVGASVIALFWRHGWLAAGVFRPYHFLRQRQWATPVTSAFLHADMGHLLFNAITFWAFAFPLERMIGSARLLALYAFGLAVSTLGTWLQHRNDPRYATLGASGAILAVLFAFIVYQPGASMFVFPLPVPIPAPLFALLYLGFSIWASRRGGGRVNHEAHLGGAVAGVLFVLLTDAQAMWQAVQRVAGGG